MRTSRLDESVRRLPDWLQTTIALAIIAALTAFKLTAGHSVTLIDFLFIPVVSVGWFARRRSLGYVVAVVAAADTVVVTMVAETQAAFGAALASGAARLALYLAVLGVLGMMRRERALHTWAVRTDPLTGAANARAFRELAEAEVARSRRYGLTLSLAYLDLDDFKRINDAFGHDAGDHVLLSASHVMRSTVRATDSVARLGGDEFAILMPETDAEAARTVISRVRGELARLVTEGGEPVRFSIGIVTFDRPPASVGELTAAADELMYRAKRSGKDRIEQAERAGSQAARPARKAVAMLR